MSDIFKEVDEADRKDRLEEFWETYKVFIYGAVATIIGGVATWEAYKWNTQRNAAARMLVFEQALNHQEAGDFAAAADVFSELVNERSPISALSAHYLSNLQTSELNKPEEGLETLLAVDDVNSVYGQLALMKYAYARASEKNLSEIEELLSPLLERQTAIAALANELAAAKAFEAGAFDKAKAYYNRLDSVDPKPRGMLQRIMKAKAALEFLAPTELPTETATVANTYSGSDANADDDASGTELRGQPPSADGLEDTVGEDSTTSDTQDLTLDGSE